MVRLIKKSRGNYTNTDNTLVRDPKLTWKARGIFNYLWSQADGWNFYVSEIAKHSIDGEDALRSGLNELENRGYLKRVNRHTEKGKFDGLEWVLDDTGQLNRHRENPDDGENSQKQQKVRDLSEDGKTGGRKNRRTENPTLRNNNNKNYQDKEISIESHHHLDDDENYILFRQLLESYQKLTGCKFTKTEQQSVVSNYMTKLPIETVKEVINNAIAAPDKNNSIAYLFKCLDNAVKSVEAQYG